MSEHTPTTTPAEAYSRVRLWLGKYNDQEEPLVCLIQGIIERHDDLLEACKASLIIIQEILRQYRHYDESGRRTKLPIERTLEAAIAEAKRKP